MVNFDQALSNAQDFAALARRCLDPLPARVEQPGPAPSLVATSAAGQGRQALNPLHSDEKSSGRFPAIPAAQSLNTPLCAAAVLVPVLDRTQPTVLFTKRPEHLKSHAGQISFPGGKVEPDDFNIVDTALRETHEEVGIERTLIKPLGLLDRYPTSTGFDIWPVVALVDATASVSPARSEVEEAFEVPLAFVMDESNYEIHDWDWRGKTWHFHAISYSDHYIWGATAGILKNLLRRLANI